MNLAPQKFMKKKFWQNQLSAYFSYILIINFDIELYYYIIIFKYHMTKNAIYDTLIIFNKSFYLTLIAVLKKFIGALCIVQ